MKSHATYHRPGKARFFGPRFAEGTVKYSHRLAQASKMAKTAATYPADRLPDGWPIVSVQFHAYEDTGFTKTLWKSLDEAQDYFKKHPTLAAAVFTP